MASRIIINNRTALPDRVAMMLVQRVIDDGLISEGRFGPQYCFLTIFKNPYTSYDKAPFIAISALLTKAGTHVFTMLPYNHDIDGVNSDVGAS